MANVFQYRSGELLKTRLPVASGTVIEVGDHLRLSSGKAMTVRSAADNLLFRGKALEAHSSTDKSGDILVAFPTPTAIFEVDLDASTTITFGDNLQLNGEQALKKSDTDAVATAVESKLSATKILASYKLLNAATSGVRQVGDAS